jgi:predicted neutral ceramidase superfamily lipid hydrolase
MTKKSSDINWLQQDLVKVARIHFYYVFAFAATIAAFDAWRLIPADALRERWTLAAAMLVAVTLIWYAARNNVRSNAFYVALTYSLITVDILIAALSVYAQRGMASRAVALFAIPLIVAALLLSRSALFATAALCTAAYSLAAVRYFADNPSEGYKIELYGDIAFYSASFFIMAALLWAVIRHKTAR